MDKLGGENLSAMKSKFRIKIGDKAKVVFNGRVRELEVVDIETSKNKTEENFCFSFFMQRFLGRDYLEKISVLLPDGRIAECRPLNPIL